MKKTIQSGVAQLWVTYLYIYFIFAGCEDSQSQLRQQVCASHSHRSFTNPQVKHRLNGGNDSESYGK